MLGARKALQDLVTRPEQPQTLWKPNAKGVACATGHQQSHMSCYTHAGGAIYTAGVTYQPPALQELGTRLVLSAAGVSLPGTLEPEGRSLLLAVSFQCPLLLKLNMVPVGKEKTYKGSNSNFLRVGSKG